MNTATAISIIRGTDQSFALAFTKADGSPVDLTGQKVLFTVKSADNIDETDTTDAEAIIKATATLSGTPTDGTATLVLTNAQTSVPAGDYLYDLRVVSAGGIVSNIISSGFTILDPITNRKT